MSNPNDRPAHNSMTAVVCPGPEDYRVEPVARPNHSARKMAAERLELAGCLVTSQGIVTHSYPIGEWNEAIRVAKSLKANKIPLKAVA